MDGSGSSHGSEQEISEHWRRALDGRRDERSREARCIFGAFFRDLLPHIDPTFAAAPTVAFATGTAPTTDEKKAALCLSDAAQFKLRVFRRFRGSSFPLNDRLRRALAATPYVDAHVQSPSGRGWFAVVQALCHDLQFVLTAREGTMPRAVAVDEWLFPNLLVEEEHPEEPAAACVLVALDAIRFDTGTLWFERSASPPADPLAAPATDPAPDAPSPATLDAGLFAAAPTDEAAAGTFTLLRRRRADAVIRPHGRGILYSLPTAPLSTVVPQRAEGEVPDEDEDDIKKEED